MLDQEALLLRDSSELELLRSHGGGAQPAPNVLVQGDCLALMRALPDQLCQLIYLDPPFCSGRQRVDRAGQFADRWQGGLEEYLAWLLLRLEQAWRLLSAEGSLFVHLDRHAVHYVKVELDRRLGPQAFRNEIIWHYTGGGRSRRVFSHKHDSILWYSRGQHWTFHVDAVREPYNPRSGYARGGIVSNGRRYDPHPLGTPADDVWHIPIVNPLSPERLGYPTQKPERLLERIVGACSSPGELVADFMCGSGTTAAVAQRLGRRWLAADCSPQAIAIAEQRMARLAGQSPGTPGFRVARLLPR